MSFRIKLQVIDDLTEDREVSIEKAHEFVMDFSKMDSPYYFWFMWFANDPPFVIRMTFDDIELQDAMKSWWDKGQYKQITENLDNVPFYQEGDVVWMLNIGKYQLYGIWNPNLEEIPEE